MPGPGSARGQAGTRGLRALPLPPSPAPLLRAWASGAHACAALLRLRRLRVRRAPAPDFRARLRVLRPGVGAALLPGAPGALRAQPPVPVRACGAGWAAHPRPGARRPRLLAFQASCAPAPGSRDRCPEEGGPRCLRVYAGLIGTVVTPNYLDNVSARVAPWCGCAASGNRREECEAFRKLFTRNPCLDGAIQAFDSLQPSVLQDQTAGCCFPRARHEWPEKSWRQKQSLFCPNAQGVLAVCTHCPGSPGPALIRNMNRGRHS